MNGDKSGALGKVFSFLYCMKRMVCAMSMHPEI